MSITREQQEQLTRITTRLSRLGVKDPTGQILALDNEVKYYRDKIHWLEEKLREQDVTRGHQQMHLDKQIRELKEMEKIVCEAVNFDICNKFDRCTDCPAHRMIEALYNAGYRKQEEARWKGAGMGNHYCSLCQYQISGRTKFCPNCGAKMEG